MADTPPDPFSGIAEYFSGMLAGVVESGVDVVQDAFSGDDGVNDAALEARREREDERLRQEQALHLPQDADTDY